MTVVMHNGRVRATDLIEAIYSDASGHYVEVPKSALEDLLTERTRLHSRVLQVESTLRDIEQERIAKIRRRKLLAKWHGPRLSPRNPAEVAEFLELLAERFDNRLAADCRRAAEIVRTNSATDSAEILAERDKARP